MPYLFLLIALWPLLCCEKCDVTVVCVTVSIAVAVVLYAFASIIRELRVLSMHRPD